MPVKIVSVDTGDDPRQITLNEYMWGRNNFSLHYFYGTAAETFYGQDFKMHWDDLQNAVETFIGDNSLNSEDVALRFVHCFNSEDKSLFMRLQLCTMTYAGLTNLNMPVYDLNSAPVKWYKIAEGVFEETVNDDLRGDNYFNNFYYQAEEGSEIYESLNNGPTEFVRNLTFPWQAEVLQLYIDNGTPAGAYLHFASCSYTGGYPGSSNITWPHGLVMYLANSDDVPYLDNDSSSLVIFSNKGADMAALCPPTCNQYVYPVPVLTKES